MELPPPRDNQFLFLDMNAFFASCEQHKMPELRGRPIAVTPTLHNSGCVIAASYEAKRRGVTTGCRVGDAKAIIPGITVVKADHKYYITIHQRIYKFLLDEVGPDIIRLSIDEFAIQLTPNEQWTPAAHELACFIQSRLEQIFSPFLRCSIGIGPNVFLAKLGTEMQKPNGLVIIQLHTLEAAYQTLKLRDIPGINWGMSRRLNALGVRTPVEFFESPRPLLHTVFGITGDAWWFRLRGYRVDVRESPTKSISHSHVLAPDYRTKTKARNVLHKLCFKVTDRLREKNLSASRIAVGISTEHDRWGTVASLAPTQNAFTLFRAVAKIYDQEFPHYAKPKQVYVVVWTLTPYQANHLPLFPQDNPKITTLLQSVDSINARYGRWTIQPADLLMAKDSAPNRIAFQVPDYEMD